MARTSTQAIPACPTLFTPLQLHVRELLRFGVVSWVGWMRDHVMSLQRMIESHHFAVVVAGASVSYSGKRVFPDGDTIDIDSSSSVHRKGVLIEGVSRFSTEGREFARMHIYFRPVAIGDETSAAARPSDLHPDVQALFQEDEVSATPFPRMVKKMLPSLETEGVLLATGQHPFKLHRYAMDFADQWAFMETAAFVSASREELALARGQLTERLMDGLSQPVKEYHVDLTRPYFVLDQGVVDTRAYLWNDHLFFVHRLLKQGHGDDQVHATVIEQMDCAVH